MALAAGLAQRCGVGGRRPDQRQAKPACRAEQACEPRSIAAAELGKA
ncbi:hypothetical protein SGRA_0236 [Saprospira grandis str. Lewin]|uniref:Uncharacterized protein n=1 Tax=Saprospira grandis (strain Lewin) TaxID=984262 RepID=H6L674_SAPGL|nr:hypothetical protein SGRA_0236 [Saprospira grandis str. Lewin]